MSRTLYFYTHYPVKDLQTILEAHQEEFDLFLEDTFNEDELTRYESAIDSLAAVYVQPLFSEMTFEDFEVTDENAVAQRAFFEHCRSCLCFDNVPYLESNPFQVTYLGLLLKVLEDALVDQGGVEPVVFKENFERKLTGYRSLENLIASPKERPQVLKRISPVSPIDLMVEDIKHLVARWPVPPKIFTDQITQESEKLQKLWRTFESYPQADAYELWQKSGLNPKDFDDYLERLKLFIKRF